MLAWLPSRPTAVSVHSPLTVSRPTTVRPRSVKKAIVASMSSTAMPTFSSLMGMPRRYRGASAGQTPRLPSPTMKFGIFYEHQLPKPWSEDSEYRLLQNSLEQIELADRLGYDYAWEVEHHFLEEYSHSSAPEVFLAAASQRTTNIRLGHGIVQLTTNHPARVAERVSTLDLVSSGRVELGLGEGSSITELHPFGRRFRDKRL